MVGQLQHACKVVRPGRCFLRHIYDLLMQTSHFQKDFHVRLNAQCQADIEWWSVFCHCWNGIFILRQCRTLQADVHLYSDASGSWGCGTYWNSVWFQAVWQGLPIASANIAPKELFPILVALVVWGPLWRGRTVCAHCDNGAVVEVINRGRAKEPLMCYQLRTLFFISAFYNFEVTERHTPGRANGLVDALSRDDLGSFRTQVLAALPNATAVLVSVKLGLSRASPFWRTQDWTDWFYNSSSLHYPQHPTTRLNHGTYTSAQH